MKNSQSNKEDILKSQKYNYKNVIDLKSKVSSDLINNQYQSKQFINNHQSQINNQKKDSLQFQQFLSPQNKVKRNFEFHGSTSPVQMDVHNQKRSKEISISNVFNQSKKNQFNSYSSFMETTVKHKKTNQPQYPASKREQTQNIQVNINRNIQKKNPPTIKLKIENEYQNIASKYQSITTKNENRNANQKQQLQQQQQQSKIYRQVQSQQVFSPKGRQNQILNDELISKQKNMERKRTIERKYQAAYELPNWEVTKQSQRQNGLVKGYAANTNQGMIRNYNEDRVSIILNIMKPKNMENSSSVWPKCSFFGIYDGHGGQKCADFLRDNLHQLVIRDKAFPEDPKEALIRGCIEAERQVNEQFQNESQKGSREKSGSCAVVVLVVDDMCYVANIGDSRVIMSGQKGKKIYQITRDHKPNDPKEQVRVQESGGKVYQTKIPTHCNVYNSVDNQFGLEVEYDSINDKYYLLGPYRVFPGRLSVTRTIGDIEAKRVETGGNPNVIIAEPEISLFKITSDLDFLFLGSILTL